MANPFLQYDIASPDSYTSQLDDEMEVVFDLVKKNLEDMLHRLTTLELGNLSSSTSLLC
jgi:hypothetical protein